jgi:hypothetical protein
VGIGERVRAVHISQYCAGGLGFPAGAPGSGLAGTDSVSPGPESPGPDRRGAHEAQAAGRECARCGREISAGQPARRRADRDWVHADSR